MLATYADETEMTQLHPLIPLKTIFMKFIFARQNGQ